jgi:zinc protease
MLSTRYMGQIVLESGAGDLRKTAFDSALKKAAVQLDVSFEEDNSAFHASSTTKNLELMTQLVRLTLTDPHFEQDVRDRFVANVRPFIENPKSDPSLALQQALSQARYGETASNRFQLVPTLADFDAISVKDMARVWASEYGNPSGWVYALSGDFTAEEGIRLARTYFGSMTGTPRANKPETVPKRPTSPVERVVKTGTGDKANVVVQFAEPMEKDEQNFLHGRLMNSILAERLFNEVREKIGATYTPQVDVSYPVIWPKAQIQTTVSISGDPSKMKEIGTLVKKEVSAIQKTPVTATELATAKEQARAFYTATATCSSSMSPKTPTRSTRSLEHRNVLQKSPLPRYKRLPAKSCPMTDLFRSSRPREEAVKSRKGRFHVCKTPHKVHSVDLDASFRGLRRAPDLGNGVGELQPANRARLHRLHERRRIATVGVH